jgi:hypothetical protein
MSTMKMGQRTDIPFSANGILNETYSSQHYQNIPFKPMHIMIVVNMQPEVFRIGA